MHVSEAIDDNPTLIPSFRDKNKPKEFIKILRNDTQRGK